MTDSVKIVIVGDGAIGKTSLLMVYVNNIFPTEYVPTVFDNHDATIMYNEKQLKLTLWDTAGQEEYDKLRYLSYPNTNVFLVCFSVTSRLSFDNVKEKWLKEVQKACPSTPFVLVGTKSDIRDSEQEWAKHSVVAEEIVTKRDGEALAKEIGAFAYIESSAFLIKNVKLTMDTAVDCHFANVGVKGESDAQGCCLIQ